MLKKGVLMFVVRTGKREGETWALDWPKEDGLFADHADAVLHIEEIISRFDFCGRDAEQDMWWGRNELNTPMYFLIESLGRSEL
jgi:hypothetical protein